MKSVSDPPYVQPLTVNVLPPPVSVKLAVVIPPMFMVNDMPSVLASDVSVRVMLPILVAATVSGFARVPSANRYPSSRPR